MNDSSKQKQAFLEYEANQWFARNKSVLSNYSPEKDQAYTLIKNYSISPTSVLEVGCSSGYRLNWIKNNFSNSSVYGIEPSRKPSNMVRNNTRMSIFLKVPLMK